ncbi:MAG TPA: ankyrin repeat domain-containing protein [bacterium]|nr:ankyrin repeat domain-containing protein [bacterium]HPP88380.1 ankyrin repeat domain-containing protein [bacterium]
MKKIFFLAAVVMALFVFFACSANNLKDITESYSDIFRAIASNDEQTALSLINAMASVTENVQNTVKSEIAEIIQKSIENGYLSVLQKLAEKGLNFNISLIDDWKSTPLILACKLEKNDIIDFLLAQKVDLNKFDEQGKNPLLYVCEKGNFEIAKKLIEAGADVNVVETVSNQTPLVFAILHKNVEMVKYLLSKGANKNILVGQDKNTELEKVAKLQSTEEIYKLIKK